MCQHFLPRPALQFPTFFQTFEVSGNPDVVYDMFEVKLRSPPWSGIIVKILNTYDIHVDTEFHDSTSW